MKKVILTLCSAVLIFSGCSTGVHNPSSNESQNISMGSILILSGEGASWGNAARNGIDLAVEEINSSGGIEGKKLQFFHEDSKASPQTALSAYKKLHDENHTNFIIGTSWSNSGVAIKDSAISDQTLLISPSLGVAEFNESSNLIFNTWPHDFIISQKLAEYLYESGKRNIVIFGAEDVWTKDQTNTVKQRFEELGGTVQLVIEPDTQAKNLTTEALKVKSLSENIDGIVLTAGVWNIGNIFAKKLKEIGVEIPLYSMTLDKNIISTAEGAYNGMIFLTFLTPTQSFQEKYEKKYGMEVEIGADSAYDAVMMLSEAMKKTGSQDTNTIAEYLNTKNTWDGASGKLMSDKKGAFTKNYKIDKVQNGKPVEVEK